MKRSTLRHIINKVAKDKDQERIKAARKKTTCYLQGNLL